MQSIPFRVDRDEELLAVLMLAGGIAGREDNTTFFECFRELIGDRDDWDLTIAAAELPVGRKLDLAAGDLEAIRSSLQAKAKQTGHRPQINDQVAAEEMPLSLRVLSAYRLPDAILFGRTTGRDRPLPSGLDVCTALGSSYAAEQLRRVEGREVGQKVVDAVEQSKDLFTGSSLYFDYLDCLSTLLGEPPAAAPGFMSSETWQIKSCQTTLAGWAQLRHTWALQAKESIVPSFEMDRDRHVGFVEPNPEFFRLLETLATRTAALLDRVPTRSQTRFAAIARLSSLLRHIGEQGCFR